MIGTSIMLKVQLAVFPEKVKLLGWMRRWNLVSVPWAAGIVHRDRSIIYRFKRINLLWIISVLNLIIRERIRILCEFKVFVTKVWRNLLEMWNICWNLLFEGIFFCLIESSIIFNNQFKESKLVFSYKFKLNKKLIWNAAILIDF